MGFGAGGGMSVTAGAAAARQPPDRAPSARVPHLQSGGAAILGAPRWGGLRDSAAAGAAHQPHASAQRAALDAAVARGGASARWSRRMTTAPMTVVIPLGPLEAHQRWIEECLDSVAAQTTHPYEILIPAPLAPGR